MLQFSDARRFLGFCLHLGFISGYGFLCGISNSVFPTCGRGLPVYTWACSSVHSAELVLVSPLWSSASSCFSGQEIKMAKMDHPSLPWLWILNTRVLLLHLMMIQSTISYHFPEAMKGASSINTTGRCLWLVLPFDSGVSLAGSSVSSEYAQVPLHPCRCYLRLVITAWHRSPVGPSDWSSFSVFISPEGRRVGSPG